MKVNELMVGDWANIKGKPVKVTLDDLRTMLILFEDVDFHIEPIPLTEDILQKNGWKKRPLRYFTEWYGCFQINEQNGRFFYASIPLNYVHELQHLLRLAGIEKAIEL